jgi:succinate-acetate transporter protein
MAVEMPYDAASVAVPETVEESVAAMPQADPAVLGLLVFSAGGLVLGISLLGYVSAAAQGGSVMPIILAATGLGVFLTTIWSAALGQTFVAAVFGAFTGFWWSYAILVLGLAHNWFGIPASQVQHTVAQFLFAWAVVIVCLALVSTRVPSAYTGILTSALVAVCLLIVGTLDSSTALTRAAGVFTLLYAALGFYAFVAQGMASVGGNPLPLGTPVATMMERRRRS